MRTSKILNTLLILICITGIAITGCDSLIDRIVPADVSPHSAAYAGQDPNHLFNLYETKRLRDDIVICHRNMQLDLRRLSEDDDYAYQDATGFIETSIAEAEAFKETIVGDDNNPLSISGLMMMLTGGLVGRSFFKRPQDLTVDEARAKGASV